MGTLQTTKENGMESHEEELHDTEQPDLSGTDWLSNFEMYHDSDDLLADISYEDICESTCSANEYPEDDREFVNCK